MSARADMLQKEFEAKPGEVTGSLKKLSEADWQKVTAAEKWSVGVTAHHVAGAHEAIAGMAKTIGSGETLPHFTMAMLDEMNAQHAKEFVGCTQAEALALHQKGAANT